jgi:2-methylcitrate dehydratase PrpD
MGLAASIAGTSRQPILERASAKNVMAGVAALQAGTALDLACSGVQAPEAFLAGAFGLRALLAPGVDLAAAEAELGQRWDIAVISLKPWPACRSTHGGIEMALDLAQGGLDPATIERVELEVSPIMFDLVGKPFAPEPEPRVAAQFSLAYTTALAFTHGRVGLDHFSAERVLGDRAVRDLATRVTVRSHGGDAVFRQCMAVQLGDGGRMERRLEDLKGMPERPLDSAEMRAKLEDAAAGKLPAATVAQVERACARTDIVPLLTALRSARA